MKPFEGNMEETSVRPGKSSVLQQRHIISRFGCLGVYF